MELIVKKLIYSLWKLGYCFLDNLCAKYRSRNFCSKVQKQKI